MTPRARKTNFVLTAPNEPWNPTDATINIRSIAKHPALSVAYRTHATRRLVERGIIVSDLLYLLRYGFIFEGAVPATQTGYYKYEIQSVTPNSSGREIRAVVIPNGNSMTIKIVTVMWVDETATIAGTLVEEAT